MERTVRDAVRLRAGECCEYCCVPLQFDPRPPQIDHVIAQQHGGSDDLNNLALACYSCNKQKGPNVAGFDQQTQQITRLFNPRADSWNGHFHWAGPVLVGRTSIGRVTVDVLGINRAHRVSFRQSLGDEGLLAFGLPSGD
jgi:hypothetical protein